MKEKELIQKIKKAHKQYCEREFGNEYELEESNILGLMYTEINNEEYEVQVSYDLETEMLCTTIKSSSHEYTFKEHYPYKEMLDDLMNGHYDGWYGYAHQVYEERFCLVLQWW